MVLPSWYSRKGPIPEFGGEIVDNTHIGMLPLWAVRGY
jgi:hypothetical protein